MVRFNLLFILCLLFSSCNTLNHKPQLVRKDGVSTNKVSSQASEENEVILDHNYFKISYNKKTKLANWVSYQLTAEHLKRKIAKRKNRFFSDPMLIGLNIPYAKPDDYAGSDYDRGHMAPSEDFVWDQKANDETFVMSNMAPQSKKLNRGAWKSLEEHVRKWACAQGEVTVISGPIIEKDSGSLPSRITVPTKFFKIVLTEKKPRKVLAFIYSQVDVGDPVEKNLTSISEIEGKANGFSLKSFVQNDFIIKDTKSTLTMWPEAKCR